MTVEYCVDEFIGTANTIPCTSRGGVTSQLIGVDIDLEPCTKGDIIEKKVSLLYDFRQLKHGRYKVPDIRENAVRKMLAQCKNEAEMTRWLRPVITFQMSLDDLLHEKGVI